MIGNNKNRNIHQITSNHTLNVSPYLYHNNFFKKKLNKVTLSISNSPTYLRFLRSRGGGYQEIDFGDTLRIKVTLSPNVNNKLHLYSNGESPVPSFNVELLTTSFEVPIPYDTYNPYATHKANLYLRKVGTEDELFELPILFILSNISYNMSNTEQLSYIFSEYLLNFSAELTTVPLPIKPIGNNPNNYSAGQLLIDYVGSGDTNIDFKLTLNQTAEFITIRS